MPDLSSVSRPVPSVLLSNPDSGWNRRHLARLSAMAERWGIRHEVCRWDDLPNRLPGLMADEPAQLIINGGDGTIDTVIGWLCARGGAMPDLVILGGGTTNMIRRDVGWPGPPDRAFARLMQGGSRIVTRRPIRLEMDGAPPRYGFFLGVAALPRAILYTRERWHARGLSGPLSEALVLARMLLRLARKKIEDDPVLAPQPVAWDDDAPAATVLGFVTTLETLVLGLRPVAPRNGLAALWLTAPYGALRRLLPACLNGRAFPDLTGLHRRQAERIALRITSTVVFDGEMIAPETETSYILSADTPLRFVVP